MKNKFNRQGSRFGSSEESKAKGGANSSKGHPTSKEIELATKAYISDGGKIDRVALNHGNAEKEVFRANLEPDSRLGWELWWMILVTVGKTRITIQIPMVQEYNYCVA